VSEEGIEVVVVSVEEEVKEQGQLEGIPHPTFCPLKMVVEKEAAHPQHYGEAAHLLACQHG
jgi:hypothetical protein